MVRLVESVAVAIASIIRALSCSLGPNRQRLVTAEFTVDHTGAGRKQLLDCAAYTPPEGFAVRSTESSENEDGTQFVVRYECEEVLPRG